MNKLRHSESGRWKRLIRSFGWMMGKIRYDCRVVNMAVQVVIGIDEEGGHSCDLTNAGRIGATFETLFDKLKARGLEEVWLVVSDAHPGLCQAIKKSFVGCFWQRCKVHFMRNILARIPSKDKPSFAARLNQIRLQPDDATNSVPNS